MFELLKSVTKSTPTVSVSILYGVALAVIAGTQKNIKVFSLELRR